MAQRGTTGDERQCEGRSDVTISGRLTAQCLECAQDVPPRKVRESDAAVGENLLVQDERRFGVAGVIGQKSRVVEAPRCAGTCSEIRTERLDGRRWLFAIAAPAGRTARFIRTTRIGLPVGAAAGGLQIAGGRGSICRGDIRSDRAAADRRPCERGQHERDHQTESKHGVFRLRILLRDRQS